MKFTAENVREHIKYTLGMCEETKYMLERFAELLEEIEEEKA